jgi:hypothetical protein
MAKVLKLILIFTFDKCGEISKELKVLSTGLTLQI